MKRVFFPAVAASVLLGCSGQAQQIDTAQVAPQSNSDVVMPLKTLADQINLAVGAALETRHLEDPQFRETLIREFNQITPENEMKFGYVQPQRGVFDFEKPDQLVDFAQEHDMVVKGHALVWHIQNPKWLEETEWTKEELTKVLEEHIHTVVGHYKGRVLYWDVVNEAFDDQGGFRDTLWYRTLGEDYIEMAFRFAHEADPDAILFYNDYSSEGMTAKSNAIYRHVEMLVERGVPIHGVGTQLHLTADNSIADSSIARNIERISDLGLDMHFTEIDVRIRDNDGAMGLQDQADKYEMLMKLAAYYPEVDMFTTWGIGDRYSWVPHWFNGYGRALMFDENFEKKPAYDAVQSVLIDAVTGNFAYEPVTDLSNAQRYVLPFNAKPLSQARLKADEVVFYPFAFNQLGGKDQRVPDANVIDGKWAVGYHKNKLIGQVSRQDSKTVVNKSESHENDNVEVFVRLGEQFWQFRSIVGQDFAPIGFPGKATGKWSKDGTTFDFEISFNEFEDLVGETIGFNMALSDNDGDTATGNRHAQLYPLTGTNIGWQGEEFGELFMNGQNAVVSTIPVSTPPAFKAMKLNAKPAGADSSIWQQGYRYTFAFNQLNQRDMTVDSQDDISGDWTMGHHGNWLYGVVNRKDDKTFTDAQESYENDNVEVFIQRGEGDLYQFRTVVGEDFEPSRYTGDTFAQWSADGSQLFFGIEMSEPLKSGEALRWNIALADNDGEGRKYQLYSVPGSNISYLGEELTKLIAE
ncbi:endo-1,4-beta-xylanase [Vibrio agarivorans]|uniref:endo-1,4-beta-xylanase n=1 Tax=Vibrio agarivorans TaxID=153622 RepID=UPI0025B34E15|nr:endo-1,4-beta-xylanase [Vibrio agarivorans]MDN3659622.1 endo-1,4-beta-xylanase [Vibrio agarivorans]